MTKIPQWPVSKYKQTSPKIAVAKTEELKRLWKQTEMPNSECTPHKLAREGRREGETASEMPEPNMQKLNNHKHNAKVHYC